MSPLMLSSLHGLIGAGLPAAEVAAPMPGLGVATGAVAAVVLALLAALVVHAATNRRAV